MKNKISFITISASIAAIYAVLTYIFSSLGLSFGIFQLRFSEALMVFAVFIPEAMWGLSLGCFISNLASPFGIYDILLGTSATIISVIAMYLFRTITIKNIPLLSLVMPVIFNALILPFIFIIAGINVGVFEAYFTYFTYIFLEEIISCFIPGLILLFALQKLNAKNLMINSN